MKLSEFSCKQIEAYNHSDARINIYEGSVRSGKSFIALLRFLRELRQGPDGAYLLAGKSQTTILRNMIQPLQELTGGVIRLNLQLGEFTLFGRKVYIVGANDERAEGKIRGLTLAGALVDEASLIPSNFFRQLLARLSIKDAKLFGTTNPDSPYHWLKADFIDRGSELDIKVFKFTLEDNPSLDPIYVENLKKEYRGLWYKRFILGDWVLAEGAIYDFFDYDIHTRKEPHTYAKYYMLGVDYGTDHPFAAVLVGFNDDHAPNIWVEKEYVWDHKVKGHQKTASEYYQALYDNFYSLYPIKTTYIDPAALSFAVELRRNHRVTINANNDVLPGIHTVANLLVNGDLMICRNCPNLIKEIGGYVWDANAGKQGEDKPLKIRDDAVDSLRYVCHTHFGKRSKLKETSKEELAAKRFAANPMAAQGLGAGAYGWQSTGMGW